MNNLSPCLVKESFDNSYNEWKFHNDFDHAVYEHKSHHKKDKKDKKDKKNSDSEWYNTEAGYIYIGGGVLSLIILLLVLKKINTKE